jgi:hypothetical protein
MAKREKAEKQEDTMEEAPISADELKPVERKAKRGRPKKSEKAAKSKPAPKKREPKAPEEEKNITVHVPRELVDLIPGEAVMHFMAAQKSFLLGMRSLIDGKLAKFSERKPEKKQSKSRKKA